MSVYPAAGLIQYIRQDCEVFVIDPQLSNTYTNSENYFKTSATSGMKLFRDMILKK
jgi:NAD-dependent deacetylase